MLRFDAARQIAASPSAAMLRTLPEGRLREIYLLSDRITDAEMRSTLMEAMRSWLRVARPARRATTLRRFCEPFEHLLCGPVGRQRKPFRIPRTIIEPLWIMIRQQAGAECLDELAIDALHAHLQAAIARAGQDHRFARANAAKHYEFWDIAGEIDGALQVRDAVGTMCRLLAASSAGRPTPEALAKFATLITSFAAKDRRLVDLFLVLLARHPPWPYVALPLLSHLTRQPHGTIAEVTLEAVYDGAIGNFQEKAEAALTGNSGSADLHGVLDAIEPAAQRLALLKQSAGSSLPPNATQLRRLESDLKNVLVKHFLDEVGARTRNHTQTLYELIRDGASSADRKAFTTAIQALSRSRALFQTVGQGDAWTCMVEEVRSTVSRELGTLTRKAAKAGPTGKRAALEGVVETLHALEQVCASSTLMPLLVNGFSALGHQDSGNLFIDFIRHMNEDQRASPQAPPQRGALIPLK